MKWFQTIQMPWHRGIFLVCLLSLIMGCSNTDGGDEIPVPSSTPKDVAGTWQTVETVTGDCSGEQYPFTVYDTYLVTQSGSNLTITIQSRSVQVTGTISGNHISWQGSFPDDGGTLSVVFSGALNSVSQISGTGTWEWSDGSYTCHGTTQILATNPENKAAGYWQGSWESSRFGLSGTFSANIQQQGSTLTGTISVSEVVINDEPLKGTSTGNKIVFGDINDRIVFSGNITDLNKAGGTYQFNSILDSGTWTATRANP